MYGFFIFSGALRIFQVAQKKFSGTSQKILTYLKIKNDVPQNKK